MKIFHLEWDTDYAQTPLISTLKRTLGSKGNKLYTQHWHAWSWYDMVFTQMLSKNTKTQGTAQPEKTGYAD